MWSPGLPRSSGLIVAADQRRMARLSEAESIHLLGSVAFGRIVPELEAHAGHTTEQSG